MTEIIWYNGDRVVKAGWWLCKNGMKVEYLGLTYTGGETK